MAQPADCVRFGATVAIRGENGAERRCRLVSVDEAAPARGVAELALTPRRGARKRLRAHDVVQTLMTTSTAFPTGWDFATDYLNEHQQGLGDRTAQLAVRHALVQIGNSSPVDAGWLRERRAPVLFVALNNPAYTWRVREAIPVDARVIFLGSELLRRGDRPTAGVVGHELAHVWREDRGLNLTGQEEEREADAKAADWGLGDALLESLRADADDPAYASRRSDLQARIEALLRHPKLGTEDA
jgi:hypothetical protein